MHPAIAIGFVIACQQPAAIQPVEPGGYLEVPLKGEFGKEITAPGVRDAIRAAKNKKANAIVLVFGTPGGLVSDAQAIAGVLDKECGPGKDLKVYSVIRRAISASVWPLSRSDRVFFEPGAAAGAAVAFHWNLKSGNAEVDAKFNAAVTAEVAGAAEARGQPGCVYRAMMLKESKLFGWPLPSGGFKLSDTKPDTTIKGLAEIDTESTVLAWTTEQAAKYGFGVVMPSRDIATLGTLLPQPGWHGLGDAGSVAMTRAFKDCERKSADRERAEQAITKSREAMLEAANRIDTMGTLAVEADPAKSVAVRTNSQGTFSSETQTLWRQQTDRAIENWNTVLSQFSEFERAKQSLVRAVDEYNTARAREFQTRMYSEKPDPIKLNDSDNKMDIKLGRKYVEDAITRLRAGRMRVR